MTRSARIVGLAIAGVAVLTGVGFGLARPFEAGAPTVQELVVAEQKFERRVTAYGNLEAVKSTPITAPPAGNGPMRIAWLADEGETVEEGDVVIRFDPTRLEQELQDGLTSLRSVQARLDKERLERDRALRERDTTAELARKELEKSREFQHQDVEIFSKNQIIESEIDEELSSAKLDHSEQASGLEREIADSKVDLLAIERERAQLTIRRAKEDLQRLQVAAPHNGLLVYKRDWRGNIAQVGDSVWRDQSIAEIPLLEEMQAQIFVLEVDAGGLAVDQPAVVVIESRPDVEYEAKIKRVDSLPKRLKREVSAQYFGVTLALETTDVSVMKPGQRVRATLLLGSEEALVLPRQAVFEKEGKQVVYRRVGDGYAAVPVELGSSSAGRVVIASGIEPGDKIALRDPTAQVDDEGAANGEASSGLPGMRP